jgi:hypothetical protein
MLQARTANVNSRSRHSTLPDTPWSAMSARPWKGQLSALNAGTLGGKAAATKGDIIARYITPEQFQESCRPGRAGFSRCGVRPDSMARFDDRMVSTGKQALAVFVQRRLRHHQETLQKMKQPIPATDNQSTWRTPIESKRAEVERISRTRISKPKVSLSFYGVLCIYLALMVFAWGTSYKLSLYKAEHQGSPAKLCTRGSDAVENALDHAANGNTVAHAHLSIAVFFSRLQGTGDQSLDRLRDEAIIDRSPLSRAPILCLRPPPDERRSLD